MAMTDETAAVCVRCQKPARLCVCAAVTPVDNDVFVLILRHPQEQDRELGTARLVTLQLKNSLLKTGLSWANLGKALGRTVEPKKWGVLYLGTAQTAQAGLSRPLSVLTQRGNLAEDQAERLRGLEGIILLDGTWQQAKALWWRNAWLLKCQRLVLKPPRRSLYGRLRKEPRVESVSTIEAAAYCLSLLADDPALVDKILTPFRHLLLRAGRKGPDGGILGQSSDIL